MEQRALVLAPPSSTLLSVWGKYKETEQLYEKAFKISKLTHLRKSTRLLKEQGDFYFNSAIKQLLRNEEKNSSDMFMKAAQEYQNLVNYCQDAQHVPVDVILDSSF